LSCLSCSFFGVVLNYDVPEMSAQREAVFGEVPLQALCGITGEEFNPLQ
jgi:hypothetical protein